jgi:hypothetical protein
LAETEYCTVPLPVPLEPLVMESHDGSPNVMLAAVIDPVSLPAPSVNRKVQVPLRSASEENVVIIEVFGIGFVASGPPEFEVL